MIGNIAIYYFSPQFEKKLNMDSLSHKEKIQMDVKLTKSLREKPMELLTNSEIELYKIDLMRRQLESQRITEGWIKFIGILIILSLISSFIAIAQIF